MAGLLQLDLCFGLVKHVARVHAGRSTPTEGQPTAVISSTGLSAKTSAADLESAKAASSAVASNPPIFLAFSSVGLKVIISALAEAVSVATTPKKDSLFTGLES